MDFPFSRYFVNYTVHIPKNWCYDFASWQFVFLDVSASFHRLHATELTASDVDIFKKLVSIRYNIFEKLYRYIDITSIFSIYHYLANLSVVTSILIKNKQKVACFVEGECEGSVNER